MSIMGTGESGPDGAQAFHPGAYKAVSLGFYLLGIVWYLKEGMNAYSAATDMTQQYPFFFDMNPFSVAGFSLAGGLYWTTMGLDRSNTPSAVAGYVMAGAHVLVFALQVYIGPLFWALNSIE